MPLRLLSPSPNARSRLGELQPLVIPAGFASLSRSDPPTPPGGPPPTPRRRGIDGLSKSDPPTPPRAPPPTPRRHADMLNSPSKHDLLSSPSGSLPSPSHSDGFRGFNSLSRRDPPTPPSGPPPSPCRRYLFSGISRRDPPTPPRGPPSSPRSRESEIYTGLSRSDPPTPPRGPPPTPGRCFGGYNAWTTDEMDLLVFVCRSRVKLVSQMVLDVGVCAHISSSRTTFHAPTSALD